MSCPDAIWLWLWQWFTHPTPPSRVWAGISWCRCWKPWQGADRGGSPPAPSSRRRLTGSNGGRGPQRGKGLRTTLPQGDWRGRARWGGSAPRWGWGGFWRRRHPWLFCGTEHSESLSAVNTSWKKTLTEMVNVLHFYSVFSLLHGTLNCSTKPLIHPVTNTDIHQWVATAMHGAASPIWSILGFSVLSKDTVDSWSQD